MIFTLILIIKHYPVRYFLNLWNILFSSNLRSLILSTLLDLAYNNHYCGVLIIFYFFPLFYSLFGILLKERWPFFSAFFVCLFVYMSILASENCMVFFMDCKKKHSRYTCMEDCALVRFILGANRKFSLSSQSFISLPTVGKSQPCLYQAQYKDQGPKVLCHCFNPVQPVPIWLA